MRSGGTSSGASRVPETVSDTGPVLHLQEIGKLAILAILAPLLLPDLVVEELAVRGTRIDRLREQGIPFTVLTVDPLAWREVLRDIAPHIQPADAQVFTLVRDRGFSPLALTDDLALRRLLETHGGLVVGTVGILLRAYGQSLISRSDLSAAFEDLFHSSSLHLSSAFRSYLRKLLADLT